MEMAPEDEPEDEPEPFQVLVYGSLYTAKDDVVKVPYDPSSSLRRKSYRRNKDESAIDMQKRIEEDIVKVLHELVSLPARVARLRTLAERLSHLDWSGGSSRESSSG